jgi:hypothetical protein
VSDEGDVELGTLLGMVNACAIGIAIEMCHGHRQLVSGVYDVVTLIVVLFPLVAASATIGRIARHVRRRALCLVVAPCLTIAAIGALAEWIFGTTTVAIIACGSTLATQLLLEVSTRPAPEPEAPRAIVRPRRS